MSYNIHDIEKLKTELYIFIECFSKNVFITFIFLQRNNASSKYEYLEFNSAY